MVYITQEKFELAVKNANEIYDIFYKEHGKYKEWHEIMKRTMNMIGLPNEDYNEDIIDEKLDKLVAKQTADAIDDAECFEAEKLEARDGDWAGAR